MLAGRVAVKGSLRSRIGMLVIRVSPEACWRTLAPVAATVALLIHLMPAQVITASPEYSVTLFPVFR